MAYRTPAGCDGAIRAAVRDDFDDVYAEQFTPMVRLAYLTTGSMPAAEDVVQEVFVALLHRPDVRDPAAWLRRAVVSPVHLLGPTPTPTPRTPARRPVGSG